jgi:hypothetical protein
MLYEPISDLGPILRGRFAPLTDCKIRHMMAVRSLLSSDALFWE